MHSTASRCEAGLSSPLLVLKPLARAACRMPPAPLNFSVQRLTTFKTQATAQGSLRVVLHLYSELVLQKGADGSRSASLESSWGSKKSMQPTHRWNQLTATKQPNNQTVLNEQEANPRSESVARAQLDLSTLTSSLHDSSS